MPQASNERLLYENPLDGSKTYFSYSEGTTASNDVTTLRTEWDEEPLVERNKRLQNSHDASSPGLFTDGRSMYHVGSITPREMAELVAKGVMGYGGQVYDDAAFNKWYMDRDFKYLRRTTEKKPF
jgi:hypothetical protein